jgi:hypothetical protein
LVLLNQGDGTFAAPLAYDAGDHPRSVAIGDLDGVNGPDLAVANQIGDDVSVLLNQGDGTFADAVEYGVGSSPGSVTIGDLDGVNGPDLAVANWNSDDVSVLLNQGDGTFAAAVLYPVGGWPSSVAIDDLDGVDGPDLAVAGGGGLALLLNQGDGTFAAAAAYGAGNAPVSVAIADLDGMNGPDLAVADTGVYSEVDDSFYGGGVSLLLNQGNGTFGSATYALGDGPRSLAIGDLDGVKGPDLAVGYVGGYPDSDRGVSVLLNQGDGTFRDAGTYADGIAASGSVAIGDLDGVNGPDLAVAYVGSYPDYERGVSVLLNQGDGTFRDADIYSAEIDPTSVAIGNLDGVNGLDIAVTHLGSYPDYAGGVSVLLNQGDGTFAAPVAYAAGHGSWSLAIGDLDGINGPDLAVVNHYSDDVSILMNRGNGTFDLTATYATDPGSPVSVAIGDLDGVRGPDLAVGKRWYEISVLLNQGDGTFGAEVTYDAGVGPLSVAIGDLDGVNGPDLAVASELGGDVSVLLNEGDGTFAAASAYAAGAGPSSVAIGDLDGVNGPDLAVANWYSADVSVLLSRCAAASCPWDLNGDGVVDHHDLLELVQNMGPCNDADNCPFDLNGDGVVNGRDVAELARHFGPCGD